MNKLYVLIVVMILSSAQGFSQTFTWTGGAGDNLWATGGNWSGGTAPNGNTHDVVFNTGADVSVAANITVKSITVSNGQNVRIKGVTGGEILNIASGNATAPAITVSSGNTLRFYLIWVQLANNTVGTIGGKLTLEGTSDADYAIFQLPATPIVSAKFTITGTLEDQYGSSILGPYEEDYLNFGAGSKLDIKGSAAAVPKADYDPASTITFSGVTNGNIVFDETGSVGSIVYNCSTQSAPVMLNIKSGVVVAGNLTIGNTGSEVLGLLSNIEVTLNQTNYSFTVNGNIDISGNSSVALAISDDNANTYSATVNGDLKVSGGTFSLQNTNGVVNPTTLFVKGNIDHSAGVITATSNATASSASLFNIEMNGTTAKTIKSTPQSFNNGNNQVALVLNNPGGVTLTTPLQVGMIGFKSNAKLNTSGTNYLTIMNPSTAAYVVSGAGFVDGPVRRVTNSTDEYIFPTGNGTTQRYVSVYPTAITSTTFEALYSNTNTSGNSTLTSPLTGKVVYNWEVDRISTSGANAQIEITLPGAISGAQSNDAIVVGKSSGGSDWVSAKGSVGTFLPGDATSGKIKSDIQTSFSSFTIAWGPMSAVLPINLLSFTATKSAKSANLNWKITGNSTPAAFDVMKSSDGANFNKIGTVTGMEGKLSYDFIDNNLTAGNNYYRLKMLDKDGTISYSNIIVVTNGTQGTIINSMMPTMVVDRARLNISSSAKGNMQLVITDINGRIVQTQVAQITQGNQEVWINAARLATGFFQVTGYINGEKTATIRFFKR